MNALRAIFLIIFIVFSASSLADCKNDLVISMMADNGYSEDSDLLLTCKSMPNDPNKIVVSYIKIVGTGSYEYNLLVFLLDLKLSKVLSKHIDNDASFSGGTVEISIDTAPYYLSKAQRAFGIRVTHKLNSWDSTTDLSLYLPTDNGLRQVLKGVTVNYSVGHLCIAVSSNSLVIITEKQRNNYNIILVKSQEERIDASMAESGDCTEKPKVSTQKTNQEYFYEGGVYKAS